MVLTSNVSRRKVLYLLCAVFLIIGIVQIESHQVCSDCPLAGSGDTICDTCRALHYGGGHLHSPPEAEPTVDANACTGAYSASLNVSPSVNEVDEAAEGDEVEGTAEGSTPTKTLGGSDGYVHIEVRVVAAESFWSGNLGWLGIGGETGEAKSKLSTESESASLYHWFTPRSSSTALCRGSISGTLKGKEKSANDSSDAGYNGELLWQCDNY